MKLLLPLAAGFALAAISWLLWTRWTPLLRLRAQRHYGRIRNVCKRYLDGSYTIEEASRRMVFLLRQPPNLRGYTEDFGPLKPVEAAQASLVSVNLLVTPKGYSPTDPRVNRLLERVMQNFQPHRAE